METAKKQERVIYYQPKTRDGKETGKARISGRFLFLDLPPSIDYVRIGWDTNKHSIVIQPTHDKDPYRLKVNRKINAVYVGGLAKQLSLTLPKGPVSYEVEKGGYIVKVGGNK